ncbi:MAG: hypothetical protein ACJ79I_03900 [Gemmatimonadaceae bacterium]
MHHSSRLILRWVFVSMDDRRKAEAIAAAKREIARRISRFCTSLSHDDFEKLLDRMARIHWKYDVYPHVVASDVDAIKERELGEQLQIGNHKRTGS